jgi:hypothetical protein
MRNLVIAKNISEVTMEQLSFNQRNFGVKEFGGSNSILILNDITMEGSGDRYYNRMYANSDVLYAANKSKTVVEWMGIRNLTIVQFDTKEELIKWAMEG